MSNTLPAVLDDLTYRATDLQRADFSAHFDIVAGLNDGVETRGKDTTIPGAEGIVRRGRVRGARHLQIVGEIHAVGDDETERLGNWQILMDEMEALFSPDAGVDDLEGVALDGSTRTIACAVEDGGMIISEGPIWGVATISVSLVAYDPDWTIV
jgi:hypothetical protein